ncbi:MAG: hypothetical protein A3F09_04315 [Chlamydiae bacterium RIFCSPHIGHO2_12_FULL_49_11]|nr:MAG: hypothetical protein A3F09_04315 [Chlamydiae bacterium RIFCSPHIGHO2_12_FULL_49_11]
MFGTPEEFRPFLDAWKDNFTCRVIKINPHAHFQEWVESVSWEEGHYIGYSMGGRILAYLMEKKKILSRSSIFLSTHPGGERLQTDHAEWIKFVQKNSLEIFWKKWHSQIVFRTPQCETQPKKKWSKNDIIAFFSHWNKTAWEWDLKRLHENCLYLYGEWDAIYATHAKNLRMQSRCIPEAGHRVHIDNPRQCIETIDLWRT